MNIEPIEFATLTPEEIETLQVDSALRLIGTYTTTLTELNKQIRQATIELGTARTKLDFLKNDKATVVEMLRALKVIAK